DQPAGMELIPPHGRLKDPADVVSKIMKRGWRSIDAFTDLAATRVVVDSYTDAPAVVAAITDRYPIREVRDADGNVISGKDGKPLKDWDQIQRMIEGSKSGYRAIHLVVDYTMPDGQARPVEVQIMTRAHYEWGEIQHDLTYKNDALPADVKDPLDNY